MDSPIRIVTLFVDGFRARTTPVREARRRTAVLSLSKDQPPAICMDIAQPWHGLGLRADFCPSVDYLSAKHEHAADFGC